LFICFYQKTPTTKKLLKLPQKVIGDERILGRAEFLERIIQKEEDQHTTALKLTHKKPKLSELSK
jgi:hypothetical protein